MKKIGIILFVLLGYLTQAQNSCATAAPFCASGVSGVTFPATENNGTAQPGPNYGCLLSTPNPSWYYLQISTPGTLDILIQGMFTAPPGPGQDVDFICWGPFSSLAGICNSLTAGNTIDCSFSGSFTETLNIPNGVAGEYYLVLITNYANAHQDIIFSQYAGTGSTNCGLVSHNSKICAGQSGSVVATNSGSLVSAGYSINPGGTSNTTGTFIVTPTITTTYTLYVTGFNNLNVMTTQTAVSTVSVNPQPSSVPTLTNTSCTSTVNAFNLNLAFYPVTPVPGYTVNWSTIPNGIGSSATTSLSGSIFPGLYTATITAAGGCSTTSSFSLSPIPDPAIITLSPVGLTQIVTCFNPTITINSLDPASNYTWSNNSSAPIQGPVADFSSLTTGHWTIFAVNAISGCTAFKTFTIGLNTTAPVGMVTPTLQNITCSANSIITVTASTSTTVNVTHQITSPQGAIFSSQSATVPYVPGGVGIYTDCVVDNANGCSSCNTFTITSNLGFPTYSVVSPENYTLGCSSKSVANIQITNANTTPIGGAVSYTLIGPPTSANVAAGILSGTNLYPVSVPGSYTVITRDNISFCETRTPISILSNTFAPDISALVPRQILDCYVPKITLKAQSATNGVSYLWSFPGTSNNLQGDTITVNAITTSPQNSVIAVYTLTVKDENNTCKSYSVIPMFQNLYPPVALISPLNSSITCNTSSITLTNQSSTGIPATSTFPSQGQIIGLLWEGPSPQTPVQVQSTYVGSAFGIYTLTARDNNNGCTSKSTATITDYRVYPILNRPDAPAPFILDCGSTDVKIYPNISNLSPGFTYTWVTSGVNVSGINSGTLTTTQPGIYKMITTNTLNGCSSSAEVSVINGTLDAAFDVLEKTGVAPFEVSFYNNSVSSNGAANIQSYWNFGNSTSSLTTSSNLAPTTLYTLPGTFKVTMYAVKGTCIDTAFKYIEVEIPSSMVIPNVFTPNGDNVNDIFFLKATNLEKISILIYDRWGHIVFTSDSDKGNIAWDGKTQAGKDASEGTYFYIIKSTGKEGTTFDKKGTVSLFR